MSEGTKKVTSDRWQSKLTYLSAERDHALRSVKEEKAALEVVLAEASDLDAARQLVRTVAEHVQRDAHERVAGLVTRCLQAVFGEDAYEFRIDFRQARGKTEARLTFFRDGQEIDPTGAAGGGVVDVASFALRVSCLLLARPHKRKLLVLDEPLRFLSREYRPAARDLILALAEELGVQFLIITHDPVLTVGKVIELP